MDPLMLGPIKVKTLIEMLQKFDDNDLVDIGTGTSGECDLAVNDKTIWIT